MKQLILFKNAQNTNQLCDKTDLHKTLPCIHWYILQYVLLDAKISLWNIMFDCLAYMTCMYVDYSISYSAAQCDRIGYM